MNWLQRTLSIFSGKKWYRKWIGGYWERWYIDCMHSDIWFYLNSDRVYDGIINDKVKYRPGCGFGQPYCEYYSINYFGFKYELDKNILLKCEREKKLKRIINE